MKTTVSRAALQAAFKMLQHYMNPDNRMPWVHVLTTETGLTLCSTDSLSYTEVEIPAEITEHGECLIGEKADRVLANLSHDSITLSLKPDSNTMMVGEEKGAKVRLQTVKGIPLQRDAIHEKINSVQHTVGIVLDKSEMSRLIKLSELFPTLGDKQTWIVLNIQDNKVVGETQKTDEGGVDDYPLTTISSNVEGSAMVVLSTGFLRNPLQTCGQSVFIRASQNRREPVLISDPENLSWFTMVAQMIRAGEEA
jgi:hypothetical protein